MIEIALAALVAATAPADPVGGVPRHTYAEAAQALRERRYAAAYGRFAELADAGHAPSATMALAMVCHGPEAFGSAWSATAGQLDRWSALSLRDARQQAGALVDHDRGE